MLTVREVADRYQCTTTLAVALLAKIGFHAAGPDTPLSAATVARFESRFGDQIRAKRPKPENEFTAETDAAPVTSRVAAKRKPHVMRVAHARVTATRAPSGMKIKALMENPGVIHAIDAAGTQDGDPWRGEVVPGAAHFYGGGTNSGPPAACGFVKIRAVLGDEFVPADDPEKAGQCPRCAQEVADGRGFRLTPFEREMRSQCDAYVRVSLGGGRPTVEDCSLRNYHSGPHRTFDGATWTYGADDFKPAPARNC